MSSNNLPSIISMFGVCICIILLFAARHHKPSRKKIQQIWHGKIFRKNNIRESTIMATPTPHNIQHTKKESIEIPTKKENIEIPTKSTFKMNNPAMSISNPSWRNCQRITCSMSDNCKKPWSQRDLTRNCCSDSLFTMLTEIISILEKNEISPTIIYGTLIGSLRDEDIISFTPDVDIALSAENYNKHSTWVKYLNEAGYILFKSNIIRICKASKTPASHNQAPWTNEWYPYMDVYKMIKTREYVYSSHLPSVRWPIEYLWPQTTCIIRNTEFPCPKESFSILNSLSKWYGNWRIESKRGTLIKKIPEGYPPKININDEKKGTAILWGNKDNWSTFDMYKYEAVANIINAFHSVGIDSFLTGGSALGAYRNHGWFSWDKDADLIVMSTDYDKIERALKSIPIYYYESMTHKNVTTDIDSNEGGFGYHVSIPCIGNNKTPYIDLWLFEKTNQNEFTCKGFHNGCQRWCQRHYKKTCEPLSRNLFYPSITVPYGPYMMPTIGKSYLEHTYGPTWANKCGYDKHPCSVHYNTDVFVFNSVDNNGNAIETAKIGDVIRHKFVIINDEYQLLKDESI